jgi:hypothetical protein
MPPDTLIPKDSLSALASRLSGALPVAGAEGYDDARRVHNGMLDKRPSVIVRCQGTPRSRPWAPFARRQHP